VTIATGHGKKAARNIDAWLNGTTHQKEPNNPLVPLEKLHVWYRTTAEAKQQPHIDAETAVTGFEEIVAGLSEEEARYEAQRCFSCGNCFECDGCFGACPEKAIIKLGPGKRYKFNFNLCNGCGVCYEQCPCHAIEMIAEPERVIS
jgi:Pyruvate/2-oxoacid:ferredoxin oxidoreductase delta subunit